MWKIPKKGTDGKITDLVSSGDFNSLTRLVIISTIIFKGLWKTPFSKTFVAKFDENFETTFMQIKAKGAFRLNQNDDFSACEIPYEGDHGLTMTILLPKVELQKCRNFEKQKSKILNFLKSFAIFDQYRKYEKH